MTNPVNIAGSKRGDIASVVRHDDHPQGMVSYTHPAEHLLNGVRFATNDDYGTDMAQNWAAGGTPLGIHDGIDSSLWTGSNITGAKVTFNSTDRAAPGSNSVKIDNAAVNDVWQWDNGSNVDLTSYASITIWINVEIRYSE
jgi:hypothetical protein